MWEERCFMDKNFLFNNFIRKDEDNIIFAPAIGTSSLIEFNINIKEAKLLALFETEDRFFSIQGYECVYKYNSYIFVMPRHCFQIVVYNEDTGEVIYLDIPHADKFDYQVNSFLGSIQIDKYLYLVGFRLSCLVKIDCESLTVEVIDCWKDEYDKQKKYDISAYFWRDCVYKNGYLYLMCACMEKLLKISLQNYEYSFVTIEKAISGISNINVVDDYFWIADKKGTLIRWNEETKEEIVVLEGKTDRDPIKYKYNKGIQIDKKIYYFPCFYDKLLIVNTEEKSVVAEDIPGELVEEGKTVAYNSFLWNDNIVKIMSLSKEQMYNYNVISGTWEKGNYPIPEELYKGTDSNLSTLGILRSILKQTKLAVENDDACTLDNYLRIVKKDYLK